MRIGTGFDVHRLAAGRPLILGGVSVPAEKGLVGHSDADVLVHAIMDAMLGALALGDLGQHFPDTDPAYAGISSLKLLARVVELCRKQGYRVVNADTVVIAEKPRLATHIKVMRENIARVMGTLPENIGVKATTAEGLGFCGRGEGIAAQAVVLLRAD